MADTAFVIRDFKRADLDDLIRLDARLFGADAFSRGTFMALLNSPGCVFRIGEVGTALGGYVAGYALYRGGYIASVAVDVPYRGRGYGRRLMEDVHRIFRLRHVQTVKLHVRVNNEAAVALYHGLGYQVERTIPRYYEDRAPAYLMRLDLETGEERIR